MSVAGVGAPTGRRIRGNGRSQDWRAEALCALPGLRWPKGLWELPPVLDEPSCARLDRAAHICGMCPVRDRCRAEAEDPTADPLPVGVYAGRVYTGERWSRRERVREELLGRVKSWPVGVFITTGRGRRKRAG